MIGPAAGLAPPGPGKVPTTPARVGWGCEQPGTGDRRQDRADPAHRHRVALAAGRVVVLDHLRRGRRPGRHHRDAVRLHRRRRRAHGGERADHRRLPRGSSRDLPLLGRLGPQRSERAPHPDDPRDHGGRRACPVRDVLGERQPVPGGEDRRPGRLPRPGRAHLHDRLRHRRGDLPARRGCRGDVCVLRGREHRGSRLGLLLERRRPGLGDGHRAGRASRSRCPAPAARCSAPRGPTAGRDRAGSRARAPRTSS